MLNTKVLTGPIEPHRRLNQLGLTESVLRLAVEQGQAAAANCTQNNPPLQRAIVAWGETIRSLRDSLMPEGWKRLDTGNQPFVLNEKLNLALTVATGDENAGLKDKNPSTKCSKGPLTESAVKSNALKFSLFGDIRKADARETWILLFHRDEQTLEIRAELSLPYNMNTDKEVDQWIERIILASIPFGGSPKGEAQPSQSPNPDIEVKRRRA